MGGDVWGQGRKWKDEGRKRESEETEEEGGEEDIVLEGESRKWKEDENWQGNICREKSAEEKGCHQKEACGEEGYSKEETACKDKQVKTQSGWEEKASK